MAVTSIKGPIPADGYEIDISPFRPGRTRSSPPLPAGFSRRCNDGGRLADIRVVAIEQYGAGPYGTMQLADLGADVIKIDDPVRRR